MNDPVQPEEGVLRQAVQSGDFAGAERAARLYVAAVQGALAQLPRAQGPARLREACELIEWARRCLCAARVRLNGERSGVQHLAAFQRTAQPDCLHTWKIDG
ncbi:MAG: hypothetical protein P4L56_24675 [Candidatus Sulfopaludibacter sp.]|nr:hypothetical protein [Candidatus Sulfopaludibacter sp.]